jgi:hypothetical protein
MDFIVIERIIWDAILMILVMSLSVNTMMLRLLPSVFRSKVLFLVCKLAMLTWFWWPLNRPRPVPFPYQFIIHRCLQCCTRICCWCITVNKEWQNSWSSPAVNYVHVNRRLIFLWAAWIFLYVLWSVLYEIVSPNPLQKKVCHGFQECSQMNTSTISGKKKKTVMDWLNGLAADFCDKRIVKLVQCLNCNGDSIEK